MCGLEAKFAREWRALTPLADEGLCEIEPREIRVLPAGRIFLRHLAMVFDAYLSTNEPGSGQGPGSQKRFSQTL